VDVGNKFYYDATTGALVAVTSWSNAGAGITQVVPCGGGFTLPDESTCTTVKALFGSTPFPQCVDGGAATDGATD
jgi:hypothetical protein